MTDDVVFIEVT